MNLWQNYIRPASVAEALAALNSAPGPALPLAGGTDLLLDLEQGRHSPVHTLVDVTTVPEMRAVEVRGDSLFIGGTAELIGAILTTGMRGLVEARPGWRP
jgi:carbon-monoxide dehydrogenase medium subunit